MNLIQLTMVTGLNTHSDELGEDDGLSANETTTPVMVAADKVRSFYPRKPHRDGTPRIGTRLTFDNGAGMAVTELFEEVAAKFGRPN